LEQLDRAPVADLNDPARIDHHESLVHALQGGLRKVLRGTPARHLIIGPCLGLPEAQVSNDDLRKILQGAALVGREGARDMVLDAERPDAKARSQHQRGSGIEADRRSSEGRIDPESIVTGCIPDHENLIAEDRMRTEAEVSWRPVRFRAAQDSERLPVAVDDRHEGDRHVEHALGETHDGFEMRLSRKLLKVENLQGVGRSGLIIGEGQWHLAACFEGLAHSPS
jgi:hypothetical protein